MCPLSTSARNVLQRCGPFQFFALMRTVPAADRRAISPQRCACRWPVDDHVRRIFFFTSASRGRGSSVGNLFVRSICDPRGGMTRDSFMEIPPDTYLIWPPRNFSILMSICPSAAVSVSVLTPVSSLAICNSRSRAPGVTPKTVCSVIVLCSRSSFVSVCTSCVMARPQ
jgi:hypothetical protein